MVLYLLMWGLSCVRHCCSASRELLKSSQSLPSPSPVAQLPALAQMACAKPQLADLLAFAEHPVRDARTQEVCSLASLWRDGPVALVFLRRLGCALCRTTCQEYSEAQAQIRAAGGRMVCMSFEALGEGSDSDNSFTQGKYWEGPLYVVEPAVYQALFGRKGLFNGFYGLADVSRTKLASCTERGVKGNYSGDGLSLGGQFVVSRRGTVVVDHRQQFYGDDLSAEELLEGVQEALQRDQAAEAAAAAQQPRPQVQEWGAGGGGGGGGSSKGSPSPK